MNQRELSVAMVSGVHKALAEHLLRSDGQEDLCFAMWNPSAGRDRTSALVFQPVLPQYGERRVHGNASVYPVYFQRALAEAMSHKAGLVFLHSHLGPGWQDMSRDDLLAEQSMAAAVLAATGLPLVGMTLGTDGAWSARFWEKVAPRIYERHWCSHVRVQGDALRLTFADHILSVPKPRRALTRTVSAWGSKAQGDISRLRAGVVGLGSVGSVVAEGLARMGFSRIRLIDFDWIQEHNLDRVLHATGEDVHLHRLKTTVSRRAIEKSATAKNLDVDEVHLSVVEEAGFRAALDCDLLFCCVDRPAAREMLNFIAFAHLIPVIDGGIRVEVKTNGTMRCADWKTHMVAPGRRCLECRGQYDPGLVMTDREGQLDDPSYIEGLPVGHPLKSNENVFAFGLNLAGLELLQMLSLVVAPLNVGNPGGQVYHFVPGRMDSNDVRGCDPNCVYPGLVGRGDRFESRMTGNHKYAMHDIAPTQLGRLRKTLQSFFMPVCRWLFPD